MTVPEEVGKVADTIVDALKGNPPLLFMMVMVLALNAVFLGITYYATNARQIREHDERMALLEKCFPDGEKQ